MWMLGIELSPLENEYYDYWSFSTAPGLCLSEYAHVSVRNSWNPKEGTWFPGVAVVDGVEKVAVGGRNQIQVFW